MSKLSIAYVSVIMFIIIVTGIAVFFIRRNTDKCKYDERQEIVRGRGFKYGFIAMCIANTIAVLFTGSDPIMMSCEFASLLSMFVGLTIYMIYTVWNDAYISVNQNPKKYLIFCGIIGIVNLAQGILTLAENGFDLTTQLPMGSINLLCGILFCIMLITVLLKTLVSRVED